MQCSVSQDFSSFLNPKLKDEVLDPTTTNANKYLCNILSFSNWRWHISSLPSLSIKEDFGPSQQNLDELLKKQTKKFKSFLVMNPDTLCVRNSLSYKCLQCTHFSWKLHHNCRENPPLFYHNPCEVCNISHSDVLCRLNASLTLTKIPVNFIKTLKWKPCFHLPSSLTITASQVKWTHRDDAKRRIMMGGECCCRNTSESKKHSTIILFSLE